jgi:hypothetical protein
MALAVIASLYRHRKRLYRHRERSEAIHFAF